MFQANVISRCQSDATLTTQMLFPADLAVGIYPSNHTYPLRAMYHAGIFSTEQHGQFTTLTYTYSSCNMYHAHSEWHDAQSRL